METAGADDGEIEGRSDTIPELAWQPRPLEQTFKEVLDGILAQRKKQQPLWYNPRNEVGIR